MKNANEKYGSLRKFCLKRTENFKYIMRVTFLRVISRVLRKDYRESRYMILTLKLAAS